MRNYFLTITGAFSDPSVKFYMCFSSYSKLVRYLERVIKLFPDSKFEIEVIIK